MARQLYGVDFGTNAIKIYNNRNHYLVHEKNVVAMDEMHNMIGFGDEAYEMYEKAPSSIKVSFPLQYGVIAEIKNMERLFYKAFKKLNGRRLNFGSNFAVALSPSITEVEKRAFFDVISDAHVHARQIYIIDRPIADAIGVGIDHSDPRGNMIVNIGADQTELTIISLGGIVMTRVLKQGGNRIDDAIVNLIRKKYNLLIGKRTAEQLKIKVSDATLENVSECTVFGRNVITGLPAKKQVSSVIIQQAIVDVMTPITEAVRAMIERTPPEMAADIMDTGIYLTGGNAEIKHIDTYLSSEIGMAVHVCKDPSESVIRGVAKIISTPTLKTFMYVPREKDY